MSTLSRIVIIANSQIRGDSLSGSDRIFIELAKRWSKMGQSILLITCREGYEMCQRSGLIKVDYVITPSRNNLPIYLTYFLRILRGVVLTSKIRSEEITIYSSCDFWPDFIPAWFFKMRSKNVRWVAGFYLFAPNPFSRGSPYKRSRRLRGLFYYLSQIPVYKLVRKYADMVWVTNESDRWQFVGSRLSDSKVVAVRGGVDFKASASMPEPKEKKFDAVFIGRFHPQKGVLELIDIWRLVCEKKKSAKLAIIGVGDLEEELRQKIGNYELENNIVLFGFKDNIEKLRIFKDSKVVVHPATYDSGGMAACEAMSCGLPAVSFDLPALKSYYPKGVIKTQCFELEEFAANIVKLLSNEELYQRTAKDALELAKEWDWDLRAEKLLDCMKKGEL